MLVPWLLNPFIDKLPLTLKALFIAAGIVVLLTRVVMPVLVRVFQPWLQRCP
jgi:antibiotic biosynthesis monooxygenase (ABM) superfamily enzyme